MSTVDLTLWQTAMGAIPMPVNCDYWQFAAAREALWLEEDLEATAAYVERLRAVRQSRAADTSLIDELINRELERLQRL